MSLFSDIHFQLKFGSMICDIVIVLLWLLSSKNPIPLSGFSGKLLFYLAVGGYLVILVVLVLLYVLDEPPGQWCYRLFIVIGFILFLIGGIFGLLNGLADNTTSYGMLIAILMLAIGIMLVIDFIKSEGFMWNSNPIPKVRAIKLQYSLHLPILPGQETYRPGFIPL